MKHRLEDGDPYPEEIVDDGKDTIDGGSGTDTLDFRRDELRGLA